MRTDQSSGKIDTGMARKTRKRGDTMANVTRIFVPIGVEELDALRQAARQDLRNPRDQARHLLRVALGLINGEEVIKPGMDRFTEIVQMAE